MPKEIVNKPYISKWIGRMYIGFLIFVIAIYLGIYCSAYSELTSQGLIVFTGIMGFVTAFLAVTTIGFYTTRYKIKDGVLSSWSPFAIIKIRLKDIRKVEKTRIPLYFRVGASLYSGMFYVPNLGWVKTIMTNLRDGVLITAKGKKYYMITPSRPEKFMKMLRRSSSRKFTS